MTELCDITGSEAAQTLLHRLTDSNPDISLSGKKIAYVAFLRGVGECILARVGFDTEIAEFQFYPDDSDFKETATDTLTGEPVCIGCDD